ncbi:aa3-type cytochrome oxidase subunit III [Pseudactinotalea suaedae]|uniref:aa3-type cytochrome oxidase subunit III n=1 Tax=Pseudactinotalea suaedae TaxID=1524924 RepID=UPI0012E1102A|nr:heme-copper oxidase subunit III [Pseudactinotalea suaedae]
MSSTSPALRPHVTVHRPDLTKVGVIVWLSSELMFFAGLFAIYFTHRSVAGPEVWTESSGLLNIPFSLGNTVILVSSSVTCQLGVRAAERFQSVRTGSLLNLAGWGMREWFALTYLLGSIFIAGQVFEYAELAHEGLTFTNSTYGSVFYLATGFHGLHVLGGLIAFLFVLVRSFTAYRFGHREATQAVVVSYYWHFVDAVWILLFGVIYFLR